MVLMKLTIPLMIFGRLFPIDREFNSLQPLYTIIIFEVPPEKPPLSLHKSKNNPMLTMLLLLSCQTTTSPNIQNPSGDCETSDNGARTCYHAPMETDIYLPDCENTLNREYWRVFASDENSAYIIPRPDGMGLLYDLCDETDIGFVMNEYGLCLETLGANEVEQINNIPLTDALTITHVLHQQLFFTVDDNDQISPWAPPNDILEACLYSDDNDSVVSAYCETALEYYNDGDCPSIAFSPSAEEAPIIAVRLNTIYGLDTPSN